jgi:DUF917 family protein
MGTLGFLITSLVLSNDNNDENIGDYQDISNGNMIMMSPVAFFVSISETNGSCLIMIPDIVMIPLSNGMLKVTLSLLRGKTSMILTLPVPSNFFDLLFLSIL